MKRLFLPLLMALTLPCLLGMSKKQSLLITFHTMAAPTDSPKTVFPSDLNGKRILFRLVPEFTQDNIVAFQSFPAENGNGKGVTLQLDSHGKYNLELISRARKDEYLLTMVNAKPVDFVVMDEPVTDGMITIWQGVPEAAVKEMSKKYGHLKKSAPPTMSQDFDMLPTTKKEKQSYLEAATAKEKAEAARAKKGEKEPPVPTLDLPTAPTSPKIPVEGGSPPPPLPPSSSEPPLPGKQ
jgi:hypothetical protein